MKRVSIYVAIVFFSLLQMVGFSASAWAATKAAKASTDQKAQKKKSAGKKSLAAKRKLAASSRKKKQSASALRSKRSAKASGKSAVKKPVRLARKSPVKRKRQLAKAAASSLEARRALGPQGMALALSAGAALVIDPSTSDVLFEKNTHDVLPIASITKLMTALVVIEAKQPLDEVLTVTDEDIDRIKHTSSRLPIGSKLTRADMLHIALMSSENRAASALGRHYPGGQAAFVAAMNAKAKALGMSDTHYVETTGLSSQNVSSARDLATLVMAAEKYPLIQKYSTNQEYKVDPGGTMLRYRNSNRLISNSRWEIVLQKTGYIAEAGRCVVMQTIIGGRELIMVLLNAHGKRSRAADANRIRDWLVAGNLPAMQ